MVVHNAGFSRLLLFDVDCVLQAAFVALRGFSCLLRISTCQDQLSRPAYVTTPCHLRLAAISPTQSPRNSSIEKSSKGVRTADHSMTNGAFTMVLRQACTQQGEFRAIEPLLHATERANGVCCLQPERFSAHLVPPWAFRGGSSTMPERRR